MRYFAPNLPRNKHCFFDRAGGASSGNYASLNFNYSGLDSRENIEKNIAVAARYFNLPAAALTLSHQGFTGIANFTDRPLGLTLTGDALVTTVPGNILGIRTADCAPVLLADFRNGVIGAAHGGWRSALNGIIENTVRLMTEHGADASQIIAAVGPCLGQKSFEAGCDMRSLFTAKNKSFAAYFSPAPSDASRFLFDLETFIADRLKACGISDISLSGIDTRENTDFFSYRRACQTRTMTMPKDFGVQLSTITL